MRRIADGCFHPQKGAPAALRVFLQRIITRAAWLAEHGKRMTIIPNDVAYALKQQGM